MSLIGSLLGLAIFPLKAKRPEPPKEVDNLAVMALADEVRRLTFALDFWRERGNALMAENERLRRLQFARYQQQAYAQQGQQMAAQNLYNQLQALGQQQMAAQNAYSQGLQQNAFAGQCTCVPARAQALNADGLEGMRARLAAKQEPR